MSDNEPKAGFAGWWMVGVLMLFYILSVFDRNIIYQLVEPIQQETGFSDFQMSMITGPAFAVTFGLFGIPLGRMADRMDRRKLVFGGVAVWSVSAMLTAFSKSFPLMIGSRIGVGMGEAALAPSAYTLIADKFPRRQLTTALSVYAMSSKIAVGLAMFAGGMAITFSKSIGPVYIPVVGELTAWRMALLMIAIPGIFLALLAFSFREPERKASHKDKADWPTTKAWLIENWRFIATLLGGFCFGGLAAGGLVAWLPTLVTRKFGLDNTQYGPIFGMINLAGALTMPLKGVIIDWLYKRGMTDAHARFYSWALAVSLPIAIIAFTTTNLTVFYFGYAGLEIILIAFMFYMSATVQMVTPVMMRGLVSGIFVSTCTAVATGLGSPLVAAVTDYGFGDKAALDKSLLAVSLVTISIAFVFIRMALPKIRAGMTATGAAQA